MSKKILFIEDDKDQLDIYKTKFKLEGFEFISASTGADGLKFALSKIPDLIFLDILLPDSKGTELLKKIKNNKKTKDIPVIMLTNLSKINLEDEAKKNGATDYIIKTSINLKDLIDKVKEILK